MKMPKVCRGCFKEWEEGEKRCPHCGWEPGGACETIWGWTAGDVFEKRYLLGMAYCATEDAVTWRIYDNLLKISCFVLCTADESAESLRGRREQIRRACHHREASVKLLAIKTIGGKRVLVYSMEELPDGAEVLGEVFREGVCREEAPACMTESPEPESRKEQALLNGTVLDGRYRILDCIGVGGFGMIYLCEELLMGRLTAVKEYFPSEWAEREQPYVAVKQSRMVEAYRFGLQSFYKEARILAKFIHTPHIVTAYDVLEANDTAYLVMEYIPGISIGREMRAREYQPYKPGEMADIILPVAEALEALHSSGILHSDISPANVMRGEEGEIFLIDLGAASDMLDAQPSFSAAFLKPDYAAPEQYRTAREGIPRDEGPWTDVYALGATMYYLLTGRKPMDAASRLGAKNPTVVLPGRFRLKYGGKWGKLINHAMALEIQERIKGAAELKEEIRKLL